MPTEQRTQKRTPATVALQISSPKQPLITELAFTENVSLRGVRVVTMRAWKPGEHVIVKSYRGTVQSRATVIYCHNLAKTRRGWVGAAFSGWDVGGHFGTAKSGRVAQRQAAKGVELLWLLDRQRLAARVPGICLRKEIQSNGECIGTNGLTIDHSRPSHRCTSGQFHFYMRAKLPRPLHRHPNAMRTDVFHRH